MSYDPHLSAEHTILPHLSRSCHHAMRRKIGVLSDLYIVGDMDQVVEFYSFAQDRRTKRSPVNGAIGADLHIIFYQHIPDLGYFFNIVFGVEAKAITADHRS